MNQVEIFSDFQRFILKIELFDLLSQQPEGLEGQVVLLLDLIVVHFEEVELVFEGLVFDLQGFHILDVFGVHFMV